MKKHQGQLIYSTKDEYGPLEVIDIHQRMRSLHFGNGTSQSAMLLYNPIPLLHKYTQALLTPLCWLDARRVLILGMGAGSISKFLHYHFKEIKLDVVELRKSVIDIAHEYFSLPPQDDRFTLYNMSAEAFIEQVSSSQKYDLIIIDLFLTSHKKTDITIDISDHYKTLLQLLTGNGSLSINLIGNKSQNYSGFNELKTLFGSHLYHINIENQNTILVAGKQAIGKPDGNFDFGYYEKKHQLPWRHYYNQLKNIDH